MWLQAVRLSRRPTALALAWGWGLAQGRRVAHDKSPPTPPAPFMQIVSHVERARRTPEPPSPASPPARARARRARLNSPQGSRDVRRSSSLPRLAPAAGASPMPAPLSDGQDAAARSGRRGGRSGGRG
eukprot:CAMPEP_0183332366 /NCGR_PEP_ID=MMETSP0164_2-20130417/1563_1 /TAXON_ID=221442 /ORGANISM="Coccolithus pelagicus ssp braarudi, Strain PLY182g" /LENGTH=127 /DNA_ID=CAMNT_0025501073 /DNA_START=327 /DNA_END=706 /DNA_ORIENTATION=-